MYYTDIRGPSEYKSLKMLYISKVLIVELQLKHVYRVKMPLCAKSHLDLT